MLAQALLLHQQGRLDEAQALFLEQIARQPEQFASLYSLAAIAHQRGAFKEALRFADRAVRADCQNPQGHEARAVILAALGRHREAAISQENVTRCPPVQAVPR